MAALSSNTEEILQLAIAEASALRGAMTLCSLIWASLILFLKEIDCQEVVRAATRVEENWTLFGPVIHDIKRMLSAYGGWKVAFNYCTTNEQMRLLINWLSMLVILYLSIFG